MFLLLFLFSFILFLTQGLTETHYVVWDDIKLWVSSLLQLTKGYIYQYVTACPALILGTFEDEEGAVGKRTLSRMTLVLYKLGNIYKEIRKPHCIITKHNKNIFTNRRLWELENATACIVFSGKACDPRMLQSAIRPATKV